MFTSAKYVMLTVGVLLICACSSDSPSPKKPATQHSNVRLVSISLDGNYWKTFQYADDGRLTVYRLYLINSNNFNEFRYYYNDNGRIDSVRRFFGANYNGTSIYSYVNDTKIDKIEHYGANRALSNTATYTYTGNQLTNIDNSNKSIAGLHFRNFQYNAENNVSMISFDQGNGIIFTYYPDKIVQMPLHFDISDPINLVTKLVHTFSNIDYTSYIASYEFNEDGLVTREIRDYPDREVGSTYREIYNYAYKNF